MGAGMFPLGGGTPNPRPNLRDFSTPASATTSGWEGLRTGFYNWPRQNKIDFLTGTGFDYGGASAGKPTIDHTLSRQTAQQKADWDQANEDWARIEAARKKRQEAYEAMAQKSGDVPREYTSRGEKREAGDPFSPVQAAGGLAPSDPMARYGRPKRWPYLQSIVNMGQVT